MGRQHGTGRIYVKYGSYYGRWRTPAGRYVNRRLGKVRGRGEKDGLSRREADRLLRRLMEADQGRAQPEARARTVDEAADVLRQRLVVQGSRLSYRQNCESMQRVHVSPVARQAARRRRDAGRRRSPSTRDVGAWARAQDGAQRHDVPARGLRARGGEQLGAQQPRPARCSTPAPGGTAMRIRICNS